MGLVSLQQSLESLLPLSALWQVKAQGGDGSLQPGKGSHQNLTLLAPGSCTSRIQNCRKELSVVYKPPSLCYFVMEAQTN